MKDDRTEARPKRSFYILLGLLAATLAYLAFSLSSDDREIPPDRFRELCLEGTVERIWVYGHEVKAQFKRQVPIENEFLWGAKTIVQEDLSNDFDALAALTEGVPPEAVEFVPPRDYTWTVIAWTVVLSTIPVLYGAIWIFNALTQRGALEKFGFFPGNRLTRLIEANQYDEAVRVGRELLAKHPKNPHVRLNLANALLLNGNIEGAREIHEGMDVSTLEGEWLSFYEKQHEAIEAISKQSDA